MWFITDVSVQLIGHGTNADRLYRNVGHSTLREVPKERRSTLSSYLRNSHKVIIVAISVVGI